MHVDISCPACQVGLIRIEPALLAQGASFSCQHCQSKVSVAQSSKAQLTDGVQSYQEYRETLQGLQSDGNNPLGNP